MGSIIKVNEYKDFGNNAIMTSDGAGVVTPNATGIKNTPSFLVRRSSDQSFSAGAWTKIQFDSEEFDTDGVFDSSTNYRFTPTTAGKYVFVVNGGLIYSGTATINGIGFYKNTTSFLS